MHATASGPIDETQLASRRPGAEPLGSGGAPADPLLESAARVFGTGVIADDGRSTVPHQFDVPLLPRRTAGFDRQLARASV